MDVHSKEDLQVYRKCALVCLLTCFPYQCLARIQDESGAKVSSWLSSPGLELDESKIKDLLHIAIEHGNCSIGISLGAPNDSTACRLDSLPPSSDQTEQCKRDRVCAYECKRRELSSVLWYDQDRKAAVLALRATFTTQNRFLDLQCWRHRIEGTSTPRKGDSSSLCYRQIHLAVAEMKEQADKENVFCHTGFYKALGSCVTERPLRFLIKRMESKELDSLWCIGMSLGGALAALVGACAAKLLPETQVEVVSLGAPMFGNSACNKLVLQMLSRTGRFRCRWTRVYKENDIVPKLPASFMRSGSYEHPKSTDGPPGIKDLYKEVKEVSDGSRAQGIRHCLWHTCLNRMDRSYYSHAVYYGIPEVIS